MEDARLQQALAAVAARDEEMGGLAASVVDWLTAGEGMDVIDLAGVQRFVWYQLPVKWLGPPELHREAVEAAALLFDELGLSRYAAVCRSPETAEVHEAYARSQQEGFKAFREAYRRSGVDPPNLEDFVWGDVMGFEEASARATAERALEDAMEAGSLVPGARGWRTTAAAVTAGVLDGAHPDLTGQTYRTAVVTERLEAWLRRVERHSPALHGLRSAHVNEMLYPVEVPADAGERMEPVTWLLSQVDEGVRLTGAGYLPPALVVEGWERFSWGLGWTDRPPRSESEVVPLSEIHDLLRRVKAVRRRGKELRLSKLGQRMGCDLETGWRTVAAGLSDGEWRRAVAEVYALLLLDGEERDDQLAAKATAILGETGWHNDGAPPEARAVRVAWWATWRPLAALGGVESAGDWTSRLTRLTAFGAATLLEQVRVDATGRRKGPW